MRISYIPGHYTWFTIIHGENNILLKQFENAGADKFIKRKNIAYNDHSLKIKITLLGSVKIFENNTQSMEIAKNH